MRWEGKKEVVTDGEEEKKELGFGDLCRSYHRSLRTERDDYTAHNVSETLTGQMTSTLTPDCNGYDRDVEACSLPLRGPRRDVPGEHAATPG